MIFLVVSCQTEVWREWSSVYVVQSARLGEVNFSVLDVTGRVCHLEGKQIKCLMAAGTALLSDRGTATSDFWFLPSANSKSNAFSVSNTFFLKSVVGSVVENTLFLVAFVIYNIVLI